MSYRQHCVISLVIIVLVWMCYVSYSDNQGVSSKPTTQVGPIYATAKNKLVQKNCGAKRRLYEFDDGVAHPYYQKPKHSNYHNHPYYVRNRFNNYIYPNKDMFFYNC